jgi:predicted nucleic acid-binding protein
MRYLDASALVKLYVDESDSQPMRNFFRNRWHFCATSLCLAEALSVLKSKWMRKAITTDEYFQLTGRLIVDARSKRIEINDVGLVTRSVHAEVEGMAKKYRLDLSDALQLVTILKGRYSTWGPESRSVLITADAGLAAAAHAEGIAVWNCIAEPQPSWA